MSPILKALNENAERWALLVFYTMLVATMFVEVLRREIMSYSSIWGEEIVRYSADERPREESTMAHIDVPDGSDLERMRMWQMVPPMDAAVDAFRQAVYEHGTLSLREREAARMRIAQINGCPI